MCTAQCIYQIYIYIYSACLSVFLSVCIQHKSERENRLGQNFVWDLMYMTLRKVYGCSEYKKLYPNGFDICEILKLRKKVFENPRTFFCYYFMDVQFKVKKRKGLVYLICIHSMPLVARFIPYPWV